MARTNNKLVWPWSSKKVRFFLSTGTISRKRAQKNSQNEFSTRYRVQDFFLICWLCSGYKIQGIPVYNRIGFSRTQIRGQLYSTSKSLFKNLEIKVLEMKYVSVSVIMGVLSWWKKSREKFRSISRDFLYSRIKNKPRGNFTIRGPLESKTSPLDDFYSS